MRVRQCTACGCVAPDRAQFCPRCGGSTFVIRSRAGVLSRGGGLSLFWRILIGLPILATGAGFLFAGMRLRVGGSGMEVLWSAATFIGVGAMACLMGCLAIFGGGHFPRRRLP
jgi:hypothetical protein